MTAPAPVHLLHVFATFSPGGPQVRAAEVITRLGARARHTIVAMDRQTSCAGRVRDAAFEIEDPPRSRGFLGTGRAMAGRIRELRPDLILTYNWGAIETILGAKLARHPALIHHEEGFGPEESQRYLRRRVFIRRLLLPKAHAVVVPSHVLERVARDVWRQPATRVRYLPNGVDLERFRPRDHGAGSDDDVVIGSVAHFRREKNQALLVRAFARCRTRERARLLLVGDGPDLEATRRLAEELGVADRVRFAGPVSDTAPAYAEMDVFALSSRTEQMPLVVLEAMASGLPVASTDVGDVKEMVTDDNRIAVTPKDDDAALSEAIDHLVEDREARQRVGRANRARCEERYENGACLRAHLDLYQEAMGQEVFAS